MTSRYVDHGNEEMEEDERVREVPRQYCALRKDMFLQKPISNDDLVNEISKRIRFNFDDE